MMSSVGSSLLPYVPGFVYFDLANVSTHLPAGGLNHEEASSFELFKHLDIAYH
jgi:hypothetical protein